MITLGSYIIAAGFFAVYGMGVETLFLCFRTYTYHTRITCCALEICSNFTSSHTKFVACSARQRSERRHARETVLHEQEPAEDTEQEEPERSRRQEGRINSTDGATAIGCRGEAIDMAQEGRGGREEGHYRHSGIGV